jgi:hypothetical protein
MLSAERQWLCEAHVHNAISTDLLIAVRLRSLFCVSAALIGICKGNIVS